jgi:methionyl-tRNA formyltransferase
MRVLVFADNIYGANMVKYLVDSGENIIGIALHRKETQHNINDIVEYSKLSSDKIIISTQMKDPEFIHEVVNLKPDIIVCAYWGYILPHEIISIPKLGCVNVHLGLIPYNRGKNPNVWPIIDGTPAGVTVHYIDEGIDSGDIIRQREVEVEITDTSKTLYNKLTNTMHEVFIEAWEDIRTNNVNPVKQKLEKGSFHHSKEFKTLSEIDITKKQNTLALLNHLRAKDFEPHPPAYFIYNGRKVGVRIKLKYID